jgi:hypothetical protein
VLRWLLLSICSLAFSFIFTSLVLAQSAPDDQKHLFWNDYVVGKVEDIPNPTVRKYLLNTHFKNQYADKIAVQLDSVGVFSPTQHNVFWLPSLDVPADEDEWRYLFLNSDIDEHLLSKVMYKKGGKTYVRMILHPFSTARDHFIELAERLGGFKYEFQAVTTASVRSFVMWRTSKSREEIGQTLDFPSAARDVFKGKVSVYNTDIDGSRLNKAKKMVRASAVSHIFGKLSKYQKDQQQFEFEREVIVGVPMGTDAGFVIREGLPEMNGSTHTSVNSEPAFSVLHPDRLSKFVKGKKDPLAWIAEKLFAPMARVTSYLLFQQGMIGEYHTQNFDYVVNSRGMPTGKIDLRDADAFRVNLVLRALQGENLESAQVIENPFHYLKEAAFTATQNKEETAMTLNSLMDYLLDSQEDTSFVGAIHSWCIEIKRYKNWCNKRVIRTKLLEVMASYVSGHVGREVTAYELSAFGYHWGNWSFIKLFDERLRQVIADVAEKDVQNYPKFESSQMALKKYFAKLERQGRARYVSSDDVNLQDHFLILHETPGAEHVRVYRKNPGRGSALVAIAIPDMRDELSFRRLQKEISACDVLLSKGSGQEPPIMNGIGGGHGVR